MRVAIVSDIHGNRTAFEAVLADLRATSPDVIFHGGDLADAGSSPAEIVDRVRDLGWPGVIGNTDEMLAIPGSLEEFAKASPQLKTMFAAIGEMADASRERLGEERLAWLRDLPREQFHDSIALVHASPASAWRSPMPEAGDDELESVYGPLGKSIAVYAHVHRPFVRCLPMRLVINTGSVSLSYDGDRRASYLLIEDGEATIRRVEYDVDREVAALVQRGIPHAGWIARMLVSGSFQMP